MDYRIRRKSAQHKPNEGVAFLFEYSDFLNAPVRAERFVYQVLCKYQ